VTLAPVGSGQQETENNNSIGNSDALALELSGNQLSGRIYGFASTGDTADYFALGNLAAQTEIRIRLDLPQTSTISTSTLRLFKGDGSEVTPNQVTPTELVHVVTAGENSTYFVALSSAEKGLLAEYFLNASLVDFVPPFIVADNLPDNTDELIHSFSLNFNKDMSAPTVTDSGNYSLIWSGPDLELSTADDEVIGLVPSYSSGLSASFAIVNGPLLPGSYEFRASGLTDTFGNTLAVLYQRNFEVISRGVDQTEVEPNQSAATATALVLNDFIPGYVTAHGRGSLRTGSNDYWSFEALGGDVLIFEPFLSQANSSTSLNYQLIAPDGSSLWSRQQSNSGIESQPPTTLPQDGRYVLRISQWNAYREEYRFRIALLDGSIGYEVEPNGVFPDASPVNFEPVNSIDTASQAGFVSRGTELDYFNLGVIDPGTTVFLSVRKPDGSVLTPIVSLYSSGGSLMSEVDGSSTDGVAEIRITSSDTYYALIQANLGSFGYAADYIFDIRKLPTDQVDFPNLQVTAVTDLPATGLRTGSSVPVTYTVTNTGSLGTGTGQWIDRIYISGNDVLGDDDDIQLAVVPHSGLLAASAGYTETQSITLPDGLPGTFHVIVETDGANTVDEVFKEGDNDLATSSTFDVTLQDYPDLVIEDLILSGPDSENRYTFDFNLANRGSGLAVGGSHRIGVQVLNASTSGVVLQDSLEVPNDLPADGIAPVSTSVVATVPGFYLVTLTADADQQLYEFGAGGHAAAESNSKQSNFQIFQFYDIATSASPADGGSVSTVGTVRDGLEVTVTATPNTTSLPYRFVNWTENGVFVSGSPNYTFTATRDRNLVAVFALPQFQIVGAPSPAIGGSVTGFGSYALNSTVSLTANPAPGYLFERWQDGASNLGAINPLSFTVNGDRTINAIFVEANPEHVVTFTTSPPGLAVIAGGATYLNGQSVNTAAPASIVDGDIEYLFERFLLNGLQLGTSPVVNKTFSTVDPPVMAYTAAYRERSLRPVVIGVTSNYGTLVPLVNDVTFTMTFDRDMDTAILPTLALAPGTGPMIPPGAWNGKRTYVSGATDFTSTDAGDFALNISNAADTNGRVMNGNATFTFTLDTTPPTNPELVLVDTTSSTARVSWAGYAAPVDLQNFRLYIEESTFTSVSGLTPHSGASAGARAYTFRDLEADTDYFVAAVALDRAGNFTSEVTPLTIRIETDLPPPVSPVLSRPAIDSARLDWSAYDRNLNGLEGFRIYWTNTPFTTVADLIPMAELPATRTDYLFESLDRRIDHYFAVVAYNSKDEQVDEVTAVRWTDPLSGTLTEDFSVGTAGVVIPIFNSLTLDEGAVLTIAPGTTFAFESGSSLVVNNGSLQAIGTALRPIHFTSSGEFLEPPTAARGDWSGLVLADASQVSNLQHVWLRFGSGLQVEAGSPVIRNFYAVQNAGAGLVVRGNADVTANDLLLSLNDIGASSGGSASLSLTGSVIKNNTGANAAQSDSSTLVASESYWGGAAVSGTTGTVSAGSPLPEEPILGAGFSTQDQITETANQEVTLFAISANGVGYRFSENSAFPTAVFDDLFEADEDFRFAPYGAGIPFQLSSGAGAKTIFAQLVSETDALSETLSTTITLVTDGPVIETFSLTDGQEINRPITVTATASAPLPLAGLRLELDGEVVAQSATGTFSYQLDPRDLPEKIIRARMIAEDVNGLTGFQARNIIIAPTAPGRPVVTAPLNGALVNTQTIDLTGTAEVGATLQLSRNSEIITNDIVVAANGSFSYSDLPLEEGANEIVVTASDSVGSSSSVPLIVSYDSGAPGSPNFLSLERGGESGTIAEWDVPAGEVPTRYRVYWNATAFSDPADASNSSGDLQGTSVNLALADGSWFVGVVAFDLAGNASPVSNLLQITADFTKPVLTVTYDRTSPVGIGDLGVQVESNEPLAFAPTLTIRPAGTRTPIAVTLVQQTATLYTGVFPVTALSSRTGSALVRAAASDLAGNVFQGVPNGEALVLDVTNPTAVVTLDGVGPIQTSSPRTLSVGFEISEGILPGTQPSLSFEPPVGALVEIPLTGSGQNWSGSLTVISAMGSGEGFFRFSAIDQAGNTGSVVTSGEILELYNSALPPAPGQVLGLGGQILAGGQVRLTWQAATRAESYQIFREPGSDGGTPAVLIAEDITDLTFVDTPPVDGLYRYAIVANLRGAIGPVSGVLVAESDRVAPDAPENVTATLLTSGVEITFEAPSEGDPVSSYRVYRNEVLLRTLNSVRAVRDYPPRGIHEYRVASVDQYGNEALSNPSTIELLVSPVRDFHLLARDGSPNMLTWTSGDGTTTGYRFYRNDVLQNNDPLADPSFIDPIGFSGRSVNYAVSALNAGADESPRRTLDVSPLEVSLELNSGAPSISGYFDVMEISVTNSADSGSASFESITINRMVTGLDDVQVVKDLNLEIAAGATEMIEIVLPAPFTLRSTQNFQVLLAGVTDGGGSRVTYEFQDQIAGAEAPPTPASLTTSNIPVAGGLTDVEVTIPNFGSAPVDLILGRSGGSEDGDVSVVVLDSNGEVVSRKASRGIGAPNTIVRQDGSITVSIPAGGSYTFTVSGLLIPEYLGALGEGATLALEIANLYSGLGTMMVQAQASQLEGRTFTQLIETPYFGTLLTDRDSYANDDEIVISGQAVNRMTSAPEANVPLRIGFGIRGFVFYEEVVTDENGDFEYLYRPPSGFSGTLNLWAAHPLVEDQLKQKSIDFFRVFLAPNVGQIVLSKSDFLDFELVLNNPGGLDLTGFEMTARVFTLDGEVETDIDTIEFERRETGSLDVPADRRQSVPLRVIADANAPDDALAELRFTSAEGASATFSGVLSLRPAVPVLSFELPSVGYVDQSVDRGEIVSQEVILENKGLRALEGVEVIPPANLLWMDVTLPRDENDRIILPDVPVGGSLRFTVVYAPSDGVELGLYDDFITIRGSNLQEDFRVNLFAQVTSSEVGSVKLFVDNIFAEPVPNAKVRLRNPNLRTTLGPFFTDANGEVLVEDLQEGSWSYQIIASGHTSATGTFEIIPGQATLATHRLSKSLVTVDFVVTPVPFTDRYEIVIEQTFETRVPVPVLLLDPPNTTLRDLPDVAEGTVLITARNEGLASLFECVIQGQTTPYGSFIPLITYLPELKAQESVVIPFKWTWDLRGIIDRDGDGATPSLGPGDDIETYLKRREALFAVADAEGKVQNFPPSNNEVFDVCVGLFLNPFPDARGMAALMQGLACCPDNAPLAAFAKAALTGYSVASLATGLPTALASAIGCILGGSIGGDFGGGGTLASGGDGGPSASGGFGGIGGCFISGTPIALVDGRSKTIESIRRGDVVTTNSAFKQTAVVEDLLVRESDDVYELALEPLVFGEEKESLTLTGTGDHYVWSDSGAWTRIDKLKIGDCLHHQNGRLYKLTSSEKLEGRHRVFTLRVKDESVYYAGGFLVQELCGDHPAIPLKSLEENPSDPKPVTSAGN
jgi:hypothetical protein